jgi:hypothetical protein
MTFICLYEDRPDFEIGLRFTLVSLARHCPATRVLVFSPGLSENLRAWLRDRPGVDLIAEFASPMRGWDAKPHCLLTAFERGAREAIWLDTDLIVTGDFLRAWQGAGDEEMIVAQEPGHFPQQGTANRARAWGFAAGREVGFTLNGSVIRVTRHHRGLVQRWGEMLATPDYRAAQAQPMLERAFHVASDQDALGALLSSAEFARLPIRAVRAGREIVHSGGLMMDPPAGRLARLGRRPSPVMFVHAIAAKPWTVLRPGSGDRNFDWWLLRLTQEISAYVANARRYRAEVGAPCPWLDRRTATGVLLRALGFGSDALRGLPIATAVAVLHRLGLSRRPR